MMSKITLGTLFLSIALSAFAEQPVIRLWPIEMVGGEENRLKEEYRDRPEVVSDEPDPSGSEGR